MTDENHDDNIRQLYVVNIKLSEGDVIPPSLERMITMVQNLRKKPADTVSVRLIPPAPEPEQRG